MKTKAFSSRSAANKTEGVYSDQPGHWYFKVSLGKDPLTGRREQLTRRGFRTATEAGKARREVLTKIDSGVVKPTHGSLTVDELLDLYLDGIDADERLSTKTRFDYRQKADHYVRPLLGKKRARDVTSETILTWQQRLLKGGREGDGRALAPNTIRLARAPLSGAFRLATETGMVSTNPLLRAPRPSPKRSIPRHWSPDQAREFLGLVEGDRTYPIRAFLLGSGLRIGELVALRWRNVDFDAGMVRIVAFAAYIGHEVVVSSGKSKDAVRSVDIDGGLVALLKSQRSQQARE
jgi:integrase